MYSFLMGRRESEHSEMIRFSWVGLTERLRSERILRNVSLQCQSKKALALIGLRRVGKSTLLLNHIEALIKQGLENNILYLNLEDERLLPMDNKVLGKLIDEFFKMSPQRHSQKNYLFFDEIQHVDGWALPLRRIIETRDCEMIVTGSSAKMLSREIAGSLRGRGLGREIFPFSFREWRELKGYVLDEDLRNTDQRVADQIQQWFFEYLNEGGLPESAMTAKSLKLALMRNYLDVMLLRDLIERHSIKNESALKGLVLQLLRNPGQLISANKLYLSLKSQGHSVSKDSVYDWLAFIEDAYLSFQCPLYSESRRKQDSNPKKNYIIDAQFHHVVSFAGAENTGHLFENLVYLDLRRAGCEVFYYLTQEGGEVDFIAVNLRSKSRRAFQVSLDSAAQEERVEQNTARALKRELGLTLEPVSPGNYLDFVESLEL